MSEFKFSIFFEREYPLEEKLLYQSMLDLINNDQEFMKNLLKGNEEDDWWSDPTESEVVELYQVWLRHLDKKSETLPKIPSKWFGPQNWNN
jgi:hypothetical protein